MSSPDIRSLGRSLACLGVFIAVLWAFGLSQRSAPVRAMAQAETKTAPQPQNVTCAKCHATIFASQPATPMGRALGAPWVSPTLIAHPKLTLTQGNYTYTVETHGQQSTYSVTDGHQTISVPIQWTFGMTNQTWMLVYNGKMYESLVSYYSSLNGLALTTGDYELKPQTLEEALGREQSPNDAKACFGCHASNTELNGALHLDSVHPGLNCEHCHAGAQQHLIDSVNGNLKTMPPDLGDLSTEDVSSFCGQCHRAWELVVRSHWHGEMDVRFQPYRLENSRCFSGTDARISCIACHDPHKDLATSSAYYDQKCLACHGTTTAAAGHVVVSPANSSQSEKPKTCPVAKSNCVSCHMPRVPLPVSGNHLTFTDHQIRIVRPGDAYPN